MSKKEKSGQSLNQIKTSTNVVFNVVFLILSIMCVIPLLFAFSISITDEEVLRTNGYQLVPQVLSASAYEFLWNERMTILRAAFMSMAVTVIGTVISIALNTSMGYVVSRRNFKLKKLYTWLLFIPMVFNGGMLASYVVVNNVLGLNNSIWALILPLACSAFSVTICRTFFRTTVPDSIIESAKIDGGDGDHRYVCGIRLLERLVSGVPVHSGPEAADAAVPVKPDAEKHRIHSEQSLWRTVHAGVQTEYADGERANGDCDRDYRAHRVYLSVLPEILYFRFDNRISQRITRKVILKTFRHRTERQELLSFA